jgi:hypothetical protein
MTPKKNSYSNAKIKDDQPYEPIEARQQKYAHVFHALVMEVAAPDRSATVDHWVIGKCHKETRNAEIQRRYIYGD